MANKLLLILIFTVVGFLLFYNLGSEFLWFDESTIAALAENVLKYGYPKGIYNGLPIWSHKGYGPGYSYISRPWLEIYIAALGRLMFGKTNFAARILFAIFGFLSLMLAYSLSKKLFKDIEIAYLSVLLLGTSTPFLLQMRQCAYYSLVTFATLWLVISYINLIEAKYGFLSFLASSTFFLLANYGIFIMVMLGCVSHYFIFVRRAAITKYIIFSCILFTVLVIPMIHYFKGVEEINLHSIKQIYPNISYYIRTVNKYILPYRFYALVLLCIFILKPKKFVAYIKEEKKNWNGFYLFACIFISSLIMLTLERHRFFRYIVNWIPLLMIIQAYIISKALKRNALLGISLLSLVIFTNILHQSGFYLIIKPIKKDVSNKAEIKAYFLDYCYEITHKYEGPISAIVAYLNKHAKAGDEVKTNYNIIGIMYYTGLNGSDDFSKETYPEWIIPRRSWISEEFYESDYYKNILKNYEAVKLNISDIPWENRPDDLAYHKFRTVREEPLLTIFRRK